MRKCILLSAVAFGCAAVGAIQPAYSADAPDVVTESGVVSLSQSQVQEVLADAQTPDGKLEEQAVDDYLAELPTDGGYVTPQDLEVGSFEVADGVTATLVAPDSTVEVQTVSLSVDAASNDVSASAQVAATEAEPTTAGPGMGSWPSWTDSPSWVVALRLYHNGNYIGEAQFQTQRRKYTDSDSSRDIWQVARRGRATPDEIEVSGAPDVDAYVKTLWVSSNLTDAAYNHAQQWRQDLTNPDDGFGDCTNSGAAVSAGPFSFTPSNCEDYSVWQGRVGHYRFSYDQGAWAGGEQRAIAYVSGFQVDNGQFPYMTWYEFVTLRLGHLAGQPEMKCTSDERGIENGTQTETCNS